ncbi:hypothetical protein VB735_18485 [Halotia wernerae UHCC 0503]|nr:hypothetical protein [Halotia wernerae UHCC 0503]
MINTKSKKTNFNGMSYREVQRTNSKNRIKLHKEDQTWLKDKAYKNIGWQNVINLYEKIEELLNKYQLEDLTLEELFLEADRIGNKYLTSQEIANFNQKLAIEVNEIAEEIDRQFPDTEIEFIDFGKNSKNRYRNKYNKKIYK